jgi:hypothetical protein
MAPMNKFGYHPFPSAKVAKARFTLSPAWFTSLILLAVLVAGSPLQAAEEPEDKYLRILSVIDQAETLQAGGKSDLAKAKYQQAQKGLLDLKQNHPVFNPKIVAFRLKEVTAKLEAFSKPPPVADASATAGVPSRPATAAAPAGAQVKLLSAGAEPRRPLRIQAKPGDKQKLGMTMQIGMNIGMGDMPAQDMKMPAITLDMEVTVKEVAANGDITYETIMGDANVAEEADAMPQMVDAIRTAFEGLKGLSGTGTISSRGIGKSTDLKLPDDTNPQMRQTVQQMHESFSTLTAGFPEEPIGPGAKWEITVPLKSQGMTITQTTGYQLASVDGENLTVKSTVTQSAANQKIESPAMPGLKMDLNKMTGKGTGEARINLTQVLPAQATMDSKSEIEMAMNLGGQKQAMAMKMDVKLKLEPK